HLHVGDLKSHPTLCAQQIRNRAVLLGIDPLEAGAQQKLTILEQPHFRLLWTASRESPALIRTFAGHKDRVGAVALTPDGRHALSGSYDGVLRLWDLTTGQLLRSFAGPGGGVGAAAVTPDGRHALSGSYDHTLRLWDLMTGQLLRTFAGHELWVTAVAVTPDGRHALSGSHDRT